MKKKKSLKMMLIRLLKSGKGLWKHWEKPVIAMMKFLKDVEVTASETIQYLKEKNETEVQLRKEELEIKRQENTVIQQSINQQQQMMLAFMQNQQQQQQQMLCILDKLMNK